MKKSIRNKGGSLVPDMKSVALVEKSFSNFFEKQ
jgi:hypothetical protein